jgi:hypothetical protein
MQVATLLNGSCAVAPPEVANVCSDCVGSLGSNWPTIRHSSRPAQAATSIEFIPMPPKNDSRGQPSMESPAASLMM